MKGCEDCEGLIAGFCFKTLSRLFYQANYKKLFTFTFDFVLNIINNLI